MQYNQNGTIRTITIDLLDQLNVSETNQFETTLEETIVKNIVPLVPSTTPSHLNFKYSEDNTYSAANIINMPK